jgi:hypothetical protein
LANAGENGWGLEVVRGRQVGRVYPLVAGPSVLGASLNGAPGIDLSAEEGPSPRKMAAKQAQVESGSLSLRDLDSPGGTFVNRQRVLPDQPRRLESGDVIQLGSVQLKVVSRQVPKPAPIVSPTPAPVTAGPVGLPAPFTLASGATCRTWDDFLTVSAQNWSGLREELTSGRLSAFLRSVSREGFQPASSSSKTADERLDEWLGRLPTSRPVQPDLEVHPAVVRVRAVPGGGLTRVKVTITNTGYRLLRSSLRVEPTATPWIRVAPEFAGALFTTAESTAIPLDITIPETLLSPLSCTLAIDSNGGVRRVEVRVEPAAKPEILDHAIGPAGPVGIRPSEALARLSPGTRFVAAAAAGLMIRGLIAGGDLIPIGSGRPSLAGAALLMAAVGGAAAATLAGRRGESRDVPSAAFAGGFAGVLAAAFSVACCRAVEPLFGMTFSSSLAACVLWAVLGGLASVVSLVIVPHEPAKGKAS